MTEKAITQGEKIYHTNENSFSIRTTFYDQKIKTLFARFDFDHNGKIEKEDFQKWSSRLSEAGKLNSVKAAALEKSVMGIWDTYFLPADTNYDGSVEFLELLVHMKAALRGGRDDHTKQKAINETLPLIFNAIDTNSDGMIESAEFQLFFESLGIVDKRFTIDVFKEMDTNHDLYLSQQEFVDAGLEFFMGVDSSSASRHFFGPIHS